MGKLFQCWVVNGLPSRVAIGRGPLRHAQTLGCARPSGHRELGRAGSWLQKLRLQRVALLERLSCRQTPRTQLPGARQSRLAFSGGRGSGQPCRPAMLPMERALRCPLPEAPAASRCGVEVAPHWASWSPWSSGRWPACEHLRGVGTRVAPQVGGPKEAQGGTSTCGVSRQAWLQRLWAWGLPPRVGKEASAGAE